MTMLLVLVLALLPVPAHALSLTFSGTIADGGTFTGTYTDTIGGSVTVLPVYQLLPSVMLLDTVTSCVGHCMFASPDMALITATDGLHTLSLSWSTDWSTFMPSASFLDSFNANGSFNSLIMVRSVLSSSAVPEPSSWLLLVLGLVPLLQFRFALYKNRMGQTVIRYPDPDPVLV
jgi:hypothetical protein